MLPNKKWLLSNFTKIVEYYKTLFLISFVKHFKPMENRSFEPRAVLREKTEMDYFRIGSSGATGQTALKGENKKKRI